MTTTLMSFLRWSLAIFLLALSLTGNAAAQDPFGADAPADADPFGAAAAPAAAPATDTPLPTEPGEAEAVETDPVVLLIRDQNPTTPPQLLRATDIMIRIGRSDQAKVYLQKLLAADPDDAALAALQRQFGSAVFFRMSRDKQLDPEGHEVASAVLSAARAATTNLDRLRGLVSQLNDDDRSMRRAGLNDLVDAGSAAVAPIVEVLADAGRADEHAAMYDALVRLGPAAAVDPLVAWLNAPDAALQARIATALARFGDEEAGLYLIRPLYSPHGSDELRAAARDALAHIYGVAPNQQQAERLLYQRIRWLYEGRPFRRPDHENMLVAWRWNAAAGAPQSQRLTAQDAALLATAQLAADLHDIAPDVAEYRLPRLATALEVAKLDAGLDAPLPAGDGTARAAAIAAGAPVVQDVLELAIADNHPVAALGAIQVLGDIGDKSVLRGERGLPGSLASALNHPNQRVRFAAVRAILNLDPTVGFPGASRVTEELGYFASTAGEPRVLIGHPRGALAQSLAGMCAELGFEADTAAFGSQLLRIVSERPDYDFIIVSDAIDSPPVYEALQLLRREPRSADIPIGILAREERLRYAQRIAADDPLTEAFPQAPSSAALSEQVSRLLTSAGRSPVDVEQRLSYAGEAIDELARLDVAGERYQFYDAADRRNAIRRALYNPLLATRAARALGAIGDPVSQRTLVDFASQNTRDIALRRAAADAFKTAVQQRGAALTQQEILRQYDRYNASEFLDKETQQVLGDILDTIHPPKEQPSDSPPDRPASGSR